MKLLSITLAATIFITIFLLVDNREHFNEEACSHEITDERISQAYDTSSSSCY